MEQQPYGAEETAQVDHGDGSPEVTSADLIEEVSIDGMCGVY